MEIDLLSYSSRIPIPSPYVTVRMTYEALTHIWLICDCNQDLPGGIFAEWLAAGVY